MLLSDAHLFRTCSVLKCEYGVGGHVFERLYSCFLAADLYFYLGKLYCITSVVNVVLC